MGIALIKRVNEITPYWIKRPFAKIIRNQLIENEEFVATYQMLEDADMMTDDQLKELQLKRLKSVLIHAYEHTSYYHELFQKSGFDPYSIVDINELAIIPVLTRDIVCANIERMLSDDLLDTYEVKQAAQPDPH